MRTSVQLRDPAARSRPLRRASSLPDVVVIGGGPAGLSAALVLARACRSVVVVDAGRPRNYAAVSMHNYLTRDGVSPKAFLREARAEVRRFGVRVVGGVAARARSTDGGFEVRVPGRGAFRCRKLVIGTGVTDELPGLPGFASFYGRSVHHCPYCDGWRWRGRCIAAYGPGKHGVGLALALRGWSDRIVALTHGGRVSTKARDVLTHHGVTLREEPVVGLKGRAGLLGQVLLKGGETLHCDALFFNTGQAQKSPLPEQLGCTIDERGGVVVDRRKRTRVPGLYVVGDALSDVQFVVTAAAAGAQAAVAICREFQEEEGRSL